MRSIISQFNFRHAKIFPLRPNCVNSFESVYKLRKRIDIRGNKYMIINHFKYKNKISSFSNKLLNNNNRIKNKCYFSNNNNK